MEAMDDLIREFLVESQEGLDQLDRDLLALEQTPEDRSRIGSIFRAVHTIKGTSGFLAFPKLERVAHVGENLLVNLRDGKMQLDSEIASGLLGMVDAIRNILRNVETEGVEGDQDYKEIIDQLARLRDGDRTAAKPPASPQVPAAPELSPVTIGVSGDGERQEGTSATPPAADAVHSTTEAALPESSADASNAVKPSSNPAGESPAKSASNGASAVADTTVRIDVEVLDKLMNLVGELVLARNQIVQFSHGLEDTVLAAASQRLNLITTELQEGIMKTRMQPIRNAWSKLPRVIRDLSNACGKQVQVQMEGAETELDKTILEAIRDPLTHIVRNAVDHGIEATEQRVAAGKPAIGTLWLRAFHEGGQVNIEIADDGSGINLERVKASAISKGIVTAEQAQGMVERELLNLILLPGFSTAAKVTNVSGRGVGMDVVKTNIERIGGSLEIQSVAGQGTTLRIKIPLTLAIVPALIVSSAGERYAIPQVSLLELVRVGAERVARDIEFVHDCPVYRLRGNLLPLVYLQEQLELPTDSSSTNSGRTAVNIVVLQAEDQQFGLVVDTINDTQEIVVKPLDHYLKGLPVFAGATIMGDGTIALILDVIGLAQKSAVLRESRETLRRENHVAQVDQVGTTQTLLLVDQEDGTRCAIRLSTVSRLEEFQRKDIERVDGREVIQYRGEIMPLVSLNGGYGSNYGDELRQTVNVVVYHAYGHSIGLIVGKIVDIVELNLGNTRSSQGSCIIQDRVTKLVDLESLVGSVCPELTFESATG